MELTDTVKQVDTVYRKLVLASTRDSGMNNTIDFDKIARIKGELVDYMDNAIPD